MVWLAKNISLEEMIFSEMAARRGIDNTPTDVIIHNMSRTALALQVIRSHYDKPIIISSGFRCTELNKAVGGSNLSHHTLGYAADFIIPGVDLKDLMKSIPKMIKFDQLIYEYGRWIHLSVHPKLRHEIFDIK